LIGKIVWVRAFLKTQPKEWGYVIDVSQRGLLTVLLFNHPDYEINCFNIDKGTFWDYEEEEQ
jgi:hypothetical protein